MIKNTSICIDISCYVFKRGFKRKEKPGFTGSDFGLYFISRYGRYDVFENQNIYYASAASGMVKKSGTHKYCKSYNICFNGYERKQNNNIYKYEHL